MQKSEKLKHHMTLNPRVSADITVLVPDNNYLNSGPQFQPVATSHHAVEKDVVKMMDRNRHQTKIDATGIASLVLVWSGRVRSWSFFSP
jgi:hypothetical protein